jgi:hypothetical protein
MLTDQHMDVQRCIDSVQRMRDSIKKDVSQRDKENMPDGMSPNQVRALRDQQVSRARNQRYDVNLMANGPTHHPTRGGYKKRRVFKGQVIRSLVRDRGSQIQWAMPLDLRWESRKLAAVCLCHSRTGIAG